MASYFKDNADLRWYIDHGIDWAPLVELTEYGFRAPEGFANVDEAKEYYIDVLDMVGEFVANEIGPHTAEIDHQGVVFEDGEARLGPRLQKVFDHIRELELHGMCLPRELDGMNCPLILYFACSELIARGDVSAMTHFGFHSGMAMSMLNYSILEGSTTFDRDKAEITSTRFEKAISEIASGESWGCMDITEPSAGSDMAALRAKGEQDEDGNWYVTGEKIFVTSGHGKYHFVIARTEKIQKQDDPFGGLGGLSLLLVPTYEDGPDGRKRFATLDRVEEKIGHHGSVTATLLFDRSPAQLIGKRGEGFKHMLTLMNGARVGVGFESIGLCEASIRLAKEYAAERPSMGKTIDRHELIADYIDEMESDVEGLRALAFEGAWAEEMRQKLLIQLQLLPPEDGDEVKQIERRMARLKWRARRVTPLLKYLAAEKAVEMARRCIQIHGGNGYTTEYGAEKLLRDALVMPIYEGTSQIQSLMAMKDSLMGIMKNPQRFVRQAAQANWRAVTAKDPLERRVAGIQKLALSARQHLMAKTAKDKIRWLQDKPVGTWPDAFREDWDPKRDFAWAMLHAERLTRLLADETICELLLKQALDHPERRVVLARYLERAEPRCRALVDEINSTGKRVLRQLGALEKRDGRDEREESEVA